jgi:molecular chaperone DnaK
VSIVQAQDGVVEVLSSHGDTQLGGDDFDELLLNSVAERFQAEHGIDLRGSLVTRSRLLRAAEAAKRHLSYHPHARLQEEFIAEKGGQPLHLDLEVTRDDYEELIRPMVMRTMDCVQKALTDAKVTASAIHKVVLVGGSTRTPMIGRLLEQRLGQPAHQEVNPDLCVAMGAAIEGAILAGQDVGAVLVDITPHSMGIKCLGNSSSGMVTPYQFAPILHRNTPLPASQSEVFYTHADEQTQVEIDVYQGEEEDVRRNHRVGKFLVENLARVPAGNPIVVQLDLTLDGVLRVSARERLTGTQKQVTIETALAKFQREEKALAKERLDRLWSEQDDEEVLDEAFTEDAEEDVPLLQMPNLAPGPRDGHRETVQAKALLEKAQRLLAKASEEDKAEVETLMQAVESAMGAQDWAGVKAASDRLADTLFYLEDA